MSRFSARALASGAGTKHLFSTGRSRVAKAMMPRFARAVGRTSKSAQRHSSALSCEEDAAMFCLGAYAGGC